MKSWFNFLVFAFLSYHLTAQTPVQGGIYANTTWTQAGSPYIVTGSIVVFPGKTLTIEPGCVVKFIADSTFNTGNFRYLEIRGTLNAVGTSQLPIVFTSTDTSDEFYNWTGIRIKGSQGGTVQLNYFELHNSFYGLHNDIAEPGVTYSFTNCLFKRNSYAIQLNANMVYSNCTFEKNAVGQAAQLVYGSLVANGCTFNQNFCSFTSSNSISVNNCVFNRNKNNIIGSPGVIQNCSFYNNEKAIVESANLQVVNCLFEGNETGINESGYSTISGCTFFNNSIAVKLGTNSSLTNNIISTNQIGVQMTAYDPTTTFISNNQLCNNTLYNLENLTDKNFDVSANCFCSSDSATIENSILDGYDDITRGLVNYTIYDDSCNSVLRVITKVLLEEPTAIFSQPDESSPWKVFSTLKRIEIQTQSFADIRIFNLAGQVVLSESVSPGVTEFSLHVKPGIYIVTDAKDNRKKIIIE